MRVPDWARINQPTVNLPLRWTACALLCLTVAISALVRPVGAQENHRADAERHLHLVVEDGSSGQTMSGVEITVEWADGVATVRRTARSDRHGHVDIQRLPPRVVTMRARVLGYVAITRQVDLSGDDVVMKIRLEPMAIGSSRIFITTSSPLRST